MNLVQVFVPLQDLAGRGADAGAGLLGGGDQPRHTAAEMEEIDRRGRALRHQVVSQQARIESLERQVVDLAGLRDLHMPGRLIPARVVAPDALAWRESQLIDAGSLRGVRRDAAVVSNYFAVSLGTEHGAQPGLAVLTAECFVGTIDLAGTHTARVRLVSDPTTRMPVTVARGELGTLDAEFWLVGTGGDRARVADVDHRYVREGGIALGDQVLTTPRDDRLPVPMVIGTIAEMAPDQDNPLLYVLDVKLAVDPNRLTRVYVVDPVDR
jgi:cell shape-determining protein MreC